MDQLEKDGKSMLWHIRNFFKGRFNLESDQAPHEEVIENIKRGVEFQGTNLWILIFAIIIASVGLNVNSTAVIIGAMLISPLMGPIMGIGLSLGINDFELFKRSAKSFGFAVGVSVVASTLYFMITPLSFAQSELLARTTPTIWDVLIATFGGLAGIVAQTRKDRTTPVIPGVAIATALMPPLCTSGFGLATGNWSYFGGAFYLFLINTVFIAFATYFMVRFLKFPKKVHLDQKRAKNVKRSMILILTLTIVPSVILAYGIVQRSVFDNSVNNFVKNVMQFEQSQIVNVDCIYDRKGGSQVEVTIVGAPLSDDVIATAKAQLPSYHLDDVKLVIRQATTSDKVDNSALQHLLTTNSNILIEKNQEIEKLQKMVTNYQKDSLPNAEIARELGAIQTGVDDVIISRTDKLSISGSKLDKTTICVVKMKEGHELTEQDKERIKGWLAKRTKTDVIELIVQ